jgi:hypothetical protein
MYYVVLVYSQLGFHLGRCRYRSDYSRHVSCTSVTRRCNQVH